MRRAVTPEKLRAFMEALAKAARTPGNVYFTGGATALLLGIRDQTIDVDLKLDPEPAGAFEEMAVLKNKLDLNVELAAPDEFIPVRPDWRARSVLIKSIGKVSFYHFDYYAQALAKVERGHEQDLADVRALVNRHLVDPGRLQQEFDDLRPGLVRYPAIDPESFAHKVRQFVASL